MLTMDVFNGDAFNTVELTHALDNVPYKPQFLGSLNIFEPKPVRTETIAVESKNGTLNVVPITPRGAPLPQRKKDPRNIRDFRTVRVAEGDSLQASEIQGIRGYTDVTEMEALQDALMERMVGVRDDVEVTHEHMRLGAIQGIVYDSDGTTVIRNWFTEFGISQPTEIDFDLDNANPASGVIRKKCNQVVRAMMKAAQGAWLPGTQVYSLCGDAFFDDLTAHKEVRETYLNQVAAAELRNDVGTVFGVLRYGNIVWVNYRGTDDGTKVAVGTDKAHFFPVGARNVFQHARSPGESFDWVNTPGREFYAIIVRDQERNMWVQPEVYSYPLFICSRPKMLQRAKRT